MTQALSMVGKALGIVPDDDQVAIAGCFLVVIDYVGLGSWNSCEGLGIQVETEEYAEGGNNLMVWRLPTRVKYTNVKLTRPVSKQTAMVSQFFQRMGRKTQKFTAVIEAHTLDGTPLATWGLQGVMPVNWTGPRLTHEGNSVATETLEFSHEGFVDVFGMLKGIVGSIGGL